MAELGTKTGPYNKELGLWSEYRQKPLEFWIPSQPEASPVIDLEKEWRTQADQLAYLFAKELGLSAEEYIFYLPRLAMSTGSQSGTDHHPLLIQPAQGALTLERIAQILGIGLYSRDVLGATDWQAGEAGFQTPSRPYITSIKEIKTGQDIEATRNSLDRYSRGGNIFDALALYMNDPSIVDSYRVITCPGSEVAPGFTAPFLLSEDGKIMMGQTHISLGFSPSTYDRYGNIIAERVATVSLFSPEIYSASQEIAA